MELKENQIQNIQKGDAITFFVIFYDSNYRPTKMRKVRKVKKVIVSEDGIYFEVNDFEKVYAKEVIKIHKKAN